MQKSTVSQRARRLKAAAFRGVFLFSIGCSFLLPASWSSNKSWPLSHSNAHAKGVAGNTDVRVNVPYNNADKEDVPVTERAIFWFGELGFNENFTDVRMIYNNAYLLVTFHIYDRLLWYTNNPIPGDFTNWDAATLYLQVNDAPQTNLSSTTFQFVAQLSMIWQPRGAYQSAYRLDGAAWTPLPSNGFETEVGTQMNGPNDFQDDRGWHVTFYIPFSMIGLSGPPTQGTTWRLGLVTHDRDDAVATATGTHTWPEAMSPADSSTWGELAFGLPSYHAPPAIRDGTTIIKHGVGGNTVVDSHAGGGMVCGGDIEADGSSWPLWGNYNRGGTSGANVQNQWNLADWPCFSKYYVTFPLADIPPGQLIISATLTLHQFGNAGQDDSLPSQPQHSLIQVLTISDDWSEQTITWNSAPSAIENVSRAWVHPLPPVDERPEEHVARRWDISYAVAEAYATGQPLRLVVYSADGAKNSGKYFRTSEFHDPSARPTLAVSWGHPMVDPTFIHLPLLIGH